MTADKKTPLITPTLAWFMFVMILANLGSMMSLPLISVYLSQELGASVTEIGAVFTLAYIVPMVLQIYGGWLSDTITAIAVLFSAIPVFFKFKLPEKETRPLAD